MVSAWQALVQWQVGVATSAIPHARRTASAGSPTRGGARVEPRGAVGCHPACARATATNERKETNIARYARHMSLVCMAGVGKRPLQPKTDFWPRWHVACADQKNSRQQLPRMETGSKNHALEPAKRSRISHKTICETCFVPPARVPRKKPGNDAHPN